MTGSDADYESGDQQWDAEWVRIREMEAGAFDPLGGFQADVKQAMEDLGNDVGRPLVMKVKVQVESGELAREDLGDGGDSRE